MKNVLLSLFAIFVAGIAAIAATTAVLNTPVRTPRVDAAPLAQVAAETPPPATGEPAGEKPAAPGPASPAKPEAAGAPTGAGAGAGATPAAAAQDDEPDKDPYEGINPEELPPDLQYNADSSVSFPTNI
jgi:hypothetical protein